MFISIQLICNDEDYGKNIKFHIKIIHKPIIKIALEIAGAFGLFVSITPLPFS